MELKKFYKSINGNFLREYSFEFEAKKNFSNILNKLQSENFLTNDDEDVNELYNDIVYELDYLEHKDYIWDKNKFIKNLFKIKKILEKLENFIDFKNDKEEMLGLNFYGISITVIRVKDKHIFISLAKVYNNVNKLIEGIEEEKNQWI